MLAIHPANKHGGQAVTRDDRYLLLGLFSSVGDSQSSSFFRNYIAVGCLVTGFPDIVFFFNALQRKG